MVDRLAVLDGEERLAPFFAGDPTLDAELAEQVVAEEGWILG